MVFVGQFDYTVDGQGRVSLPGEWRGDAGEIGWILLPDSEVTLLLIPEEYFLEFFTGIRKLAIADSELRLAAARLGASARQCRCDRQGRLTLPRSVLESHAIAKELTLIGAVTHIRLCAPENWQLAEVDSRLDRAMPELSRLGGDRGALAALLEGIREK